MPRSPSGGMGEDQTRSSAIAAIKGGGDESK
jgi:hypothetical protein